MNADDEKDCKALIEYLEALGKKVPTVPFQPIPFYNRDGDQIEVYFKNPTNGDYAQWVNHSLTLLLDQKTNEIVGCEITGIKQLMAEEIASP